MTSQGRSPACSTDCYTIYFGASMRLIVPGTTQRCVIGEGTRRLTVIFSSKTSISTPWVTMTCALLEFAMLTFPGVEYAGGQHQYQYSQQNTLETRCFYLITGRHMSKPKEIEHKWIPTKALDADHLLSNPPRRESKKCGAATNLPRGEATEPSMADSPLITRAGRPVERTG